MPGYIAAPSNLDAGGIVNAAWAAQTQSASSLMMSATGLASQLNGLAGALAGISVAFPVPDAPVVEGGTFTRPAPPALSDPGDITVDIPAPPDVGEVDIPAVSAEPEAPTLDLNYAKPAPPNVSLPARPTNLDVQMADVVMPTAPAINMPAEPAMLSFQMPAARAFTVPAFEAQRPVSTLVAPSNMFGWEYTPYSSAMLDQVKSRLSNVMVDGVSLPAHIEAQLFDQLRGREDLQSLKQERGAATDISSRGLRQPGGILVKRMAQVRAENRQTTSAANRELTVANAKLRVDTIMQALAQGASLEIQLVQSKMEENRLKLDAAKATQQIAIDLFNASVALHNADVETYRAEAQVYESRIRAMAAEVEAYGKEIEAAKLVGDYNESMARIYGEKVRAVMAVVEIYGKQVDAAKVQGEINVQKLEQVRLQIQAYGMDIDAFDKAWGAYEKQVQAEVQSLRAAEIGANVYEARSRAWAGREQAISQRVQSQIASKSLAIEGYKAMLEGVQTQVQAQSASISGRATIAQAQASIFSAEGQISAAESAAADRSSEMAIEIFKTTAESAIRGAEATANTAIKKLELAVEIARGQAQILSQLAASVMSGVSTSASINAGESQSWSWSTSYDGGEV